MSKHILTILSAILCGFAFAEFTPAEKEFMNRRRAVKRERITIGTNEYWVVTYMKGAKPDGVKTNLAYKIEGVPQTNPTEEAAKWTRKIWKAKLQADKKDRKVYENWVKDTEKARDKSSDEWKPFFQGQLDQAAAAREEDPQIRDTDM